MAAHSDPPVSWADEAAGRSALSCPSGSAEAAAPALSVRSSVGESAFGDGLPSEKVSLCEGGRLSVRRLVCRIASGFGRLPDIRVRLCRRPRRFLGAGYARCLSCRGSAYRERQSPLFGRQTAAFVAGHPFDGSLQRNVAGLFEPYPLGEHGFRGIGPDFHAEQLVADPAGRRGFRDTADQLRIRVRFERDGRRVGAAFVRPRVVYVPGRFDPGLDPEQVYVFAHALDGGFPCDRIGFLGFEPDGRQQQQRRQQQLERKDSAHKVFVVETGTGFLSPPCRSLGPGRPSWFNMLFRCVSRKS